MGAGALAITFAKTLPLATLIPNKKRLWEGFDGIFDGAYFFCCDWDVGAERRRDAGDALNCVG